MPARRTAGSALNTARQLSEEAIVQAALRLARRAGAENISMRAIAAELGVSPMAIYYHVPNKGALLDLVVDAVLSQVPMPAPDPKRWQEQLKASSVAAFRLLARYPDLSRVMLLRGDTKAGRAIVRYCITILLAAGFEARQAALAITAYNTYMYGVYAGLNAAARAKPQRRNKAGRTNGTSSPAGIGAVVDELRALELEDAIDFGIDAMLAGIASRSLVRGSLRSPAHL
jgi:AcrR family transcriptional regulator